MNTPEDPTPPAADEAAFTGLLFGIFLVVYFLAASPLLMVLLAKETPTGNWAAAGAAALWLTATVATTRHLSKA